MRAITGVFEVTKEIEEIGARVGDRIVVRPGSKVRPFGMVRSLSRSEAWWAFSERCRLLATEPTLPPRLARRRLRAALTPRGPGHLRLME